MKMYARIAMGVLFCSLALPAFAGGADMGFVPKTLATNKTKTQCLSEAVKVFQSSSDAAAKALIDGTKAAEVERERAIKAARDAYDAQLAKLQADLIASKTNLKNALESNQKSCQQLRGAIK